MAEFQARVAIGVTELSTSGLCLLITLTYKMVGEAVDAQSAKKDYRELWRRLRKRPDWQNVSWLKVVELTKRGQPHFHLIAGALPRTRTVCCIGKGLRRKFAERWFERLESGCDCIAHELSALWLDITGDSWMVHAVEAWSGNGAGRYLGKYLSKQAQYRDVLESLGFKRRFTTSRNWPGYRIMLKGAKMAGGPGFREVWYFEKKQSRFIEPRPVDDKYFTGPPAAFVRRNNTRIKILEGEINARRT